MPTLWFILVAFMLCAYVVLDGFDLGAGVIDLFAARNSEERRQILRSIGPVWDGNEVWLIAAGGTLFFTFPVLYATSFSGFYLPLMIVLWLLIVRGVAIELRSHIKNAVWTAFWDGAFFVGSVLLTIFFGAALGNVVRGVPLDSHGVFFSPLWTDFNPYSQTPGILDWYTILIGVLTLSILTTHGANFIAVKTENELNARSRQIARIAWIATLILAIPGTIFTFSVQPHIAASFLSRPWGFIFPIIALIGFVASGYFHFKKRDLPAFFAFSAFIVGMLASSAFGLYPLVLPAVIPGNSLTVQNASGSLYGQTVGLFWWIFGMILAIIYFTVAYRIFWGKVPTTAKGEGY